MNSHRKVYYPANTTTGSTATMICIVPWKTHFSGTISNCQPFFSCALPANSYETTDKNGKRGRKFSFLQMSQI